MADARAKAVWNEIVDLSSIQHYGSDMVRQLRVPNFKGDIVEVPSLASATVHASGGTSHAAEAVTTDILSLNANLDPFVNRKLPLLAQEQLVNGNWAAGVGREGISDLNYAIDVALLQTYLAADVCYVTAGAADYHDNVAAAALTPTMILNARAAILDQRGSNESNLAIFCNPYGQASIMDIDGFQANAIIGPQGDLGIYRLGSVYNTPVYSTSSVGRRRTIACSVVAITSNVATVTVPALHGLVIGMKVTIAGITTPLTTATAVASVPSATTFTVALTDSNGTMADGVGVVTVESCENIICDLSHVMVSKQKIPTVRVVPLPDESGDALQIAAIWGRIARAGRVRVLHSPPTSA